MSNHTLKLFPTPEAVALAVVTACMLTGESPLDTIERPNRQNRARMVAMAALLDCLPGLPPHRITGCFGASSQGVMLARRGAWWREDWVDRVCEALATLAPPHGPASATKLAVLRQEDFQPAQIIGRRVAVAVALGEPAPERSALAQRRRDEAVPWRMLSISSVAERGQRVGGAAWRAGNVGKGVAG